MYLLLRFVFFRAPLGSSGNANEHICVVPRVFLGLPPFGRVWVTFLTPLGSVFAA